MRDIKDFLGDTVVIGCTHKPGYCSHPCHEDTESFYTIDINCEHSPDKVLNINHPLPEELSTRFELCFLEGLPYYAYNNGAPNSSGLQHALEMLKEDGLLIISGCPRTKEHRRSLVEGGFNYIELTNNNKIILLAKNQASTISDIQKKINQHDHWKHLITKLGNRNGGLKNEWAPCTLSLDAMVMVSQLKTPDIAKFLRPLFRQELQQFHAASASLSVINNMKSLYLKTKCRYLDDPAFERYKELIWSADLLNQQTGLLVHFLYFIFPSPAAQVSEEMDLTEAKDKVDRILLIEEILSIKKICQAYQNKMALIIKKTLFPHQVNLYGLDSGLLDHLVEIARDYPLFPHPTEGIDTSSISYSCRIALKKYSLVKQLDSILTARHGNLSVIELQNILENGRQFFEEQINLTGTLELRRDSAWVTFAKICLTLLSAGYLYNRLWHVEGKRVSQNLNTFFKSADYLVKYDDQGDLMKANPLSAS